MAKKLTLFALRLMLLNFVSIFIMMILSMWDNNVYLWVITFFMTFVLFYFVWRDAEAIGQKDSHNEKIRNKKIAEEGTVPSGDTGGIYKKWFGFAAGLLAQAPAVILLTIACFLDKSSVFYNSMMPIIRLWYFTYSSIVLAFINVLPYLMFLFVALFSLVAGLAYLHGPAVDKKIETIIERNKAKKPKRVQDEWKAAKKKGGQLKPGFRK